MNIDGGVEANSRQQQGNFAIAAGPPHSLKQSKTVSSPVDTHSVSRRLQSELMVLMTRGDPGISAFPEGDNIFSWIGTIKGCTGTVYEALSFKLSMKFPTDYPFKPPTIKFDPPCFHPNVDQYGNICLDILQDKWSSAYDVRTVLLSIQSLLGEPNNDSPLNSYAAALWSNQEEYRKAMLRYHKDVGGR
ncbi:hypothetical protein KP509_25G015500 [Ceratopteris richardii]|uniref:UBC core domain-containing protein n=2 Tax=Ceratopteris richardii TaxID=49495 RepID=A0A8T2RQQ7_CERRI|nr:hypothetical protein KP509_25G015500 [Ceratopteris richardii]